MFPLSTHCVSAGKGAKVSIFFEKCRSLDFVMLQNADFQKQKNYRAANFFFLRFGKRSEKKRENSHRKATEFFSDVESDFQKKREHRSEDLILFAICDKNKTRKPQN